LLGEKNMTHIHVVAFEQKNYIYPELS